MSDASFRVPEHITRTAWAETTPLVFYLVDRFCPQMIVELGVGYGFSFLALCQAAEALGFDPPTQVIGIDTFEGDDSAGDVEADTELILRARVEERFPRIGRLYRGTFAESAAKFPDRSIDLLHVDGRHTYDDVVADFGAFEPKLADDSIVIFHDVGIREPPRFEVYRFWNEICERLPRATFTLGGAPGAGVLGLSEVAIAAIAPLLESPDVASATYQVLGRALIARLAHEQSKRGSSFHAWLGTWDENLREIINAY